MNDRICATETGAWPLAATIDGFIVDPGLAVWDYDLKPCTVESMHHVDQAGTPWFKTTTGMFDSKRMWVNHPTTKQPASSALEALATSKRRCAECTNPAVGTVKHHRFPIDVPYCTDHMVLKRPHLYRSSTTIMTLCGAVVRHDQRVMGPTGAMVYSEDIGEVHPDTCPACIKVVRDEQEARS